MKINSVSSIKYNNYYITKNNIVNQISTTIQENKQMLNADVLKAYNNISFAKLLQKEEMTDEIREKLLDTMKIDYKKNENGEYILSRFTYPVEDKKIKPKDLTRLFEKVVEIEGSASFDYGYDFSLGALRKIGGNASFKNSDLKSLNNVEIIKGNANFSNSELKTLGALKNIFGNADFRQSKLKSLDNLERIRGNANFEDSKLQDFGKLKKIGGNANFRNCKAKTLGNIESIFGFAYFGNSNLRDIGNLRFVKHHANFYNSKIPYYQQKPFLQK